MTTTTTALTDPERQFLGCLVQLPTGPARRLLTGMRTDDLAGGMTAHVLQLAIETVATGQAPAPVTLYAHAVATGRCPGEHHRHWLSGWLIDTYRDAPPPVLADHLKTVLLEAAWRRALTTHARRVVQAAESSPTDVLHDLAADTAVVNDLWTRYQTAISQAPTRLGVAA